MMYIREMVDHPHILRTICERAKSGLLNISMFLVMCVCVCLCARVCVCVCVCVCVRACAGWVDGGVGGTRLPGLKRTPEGVSCISNFSNFLKVSGLVGFGCGRPGQGWFGWLESSSRGIAYFEFFDFFDFF